jgi:hypothetical protein
MSYFYVPFDDPSLVGPARNSAGDNNPVFVHGKDRILVRPDHARTTALFVVAHGGFLSGSVIGGTVGGVLRKMTAVELADQISMDDLPLGWGDVRLIVCWGGYVGGPVADYTVAGLATATLKREAGEAPFAGQLCSALKAAGYFRMIVTGYRGAVTSNKSVVYSDGKGGASDRQAPDGDPLTRRLSDLSQFDADRSPLHRGAGRTLTLDTASHTVWY